MFVDVGIYTLVVCEASITEQKTEYLMSGDVLKGNLDSIPNTLAVIKTGLKLSQNNEINCNTIINHLFCPPMKFIFKPFESVNHT